MAGYQPLYISKMETGLVQQRQEFILPADAYPTLENAYVWREKIIRKKGYRLLGRLRRKFLAQALGVTDGAGNFSGNIITIFTLETNSQIEPGSVTVTVGAQVFIENVPPNGTLTNGAGGSGTINYTTGAITLDTNPNLAATPITIDYNYFPNLPVMGIRTRETNSVNNEETIVFDTKYAYRFNAGYEEFIPGTIWTGSNSNFFWTTNYWTIPSVGTPQKLFWATNFSGNAGDPIRYTDGSTWTPFAPQIDFVGVNFLQQCLCILPFRGRLLTFNTLEGPTLLNSIQYQQRIRWPAIGNPIPNGTYQPWVSDVRGQGGFLDLPTTEKIVNVGFVRDNLVIYCERSTWQLRYTGRSIAPFQNEKVNTELGAISTFSAVQFDTSLVGIGNQGVIECDSFKAERIDIKIPDLIYSFNGTLENYTRVHGIRDFQNRLAYWTYPLKENNGTFPDRRLVYNYENDSWAIFTDSLTALGTFQSQSDLRPIDLPYAWSTLNSPWSQGLALFPSIVGGNQQGFVEFLDQNATNDISLTINNITGNTTTPTVITSVNHNLQSGQIIKITNIATGTPFATSLNGNIFEVEILTDDTFELWKYNSEEDNFDTPQTDPTGVYLGGGTIAIRDNFSVISKKFNFLDQGQKIQMGYLDVLLSSTSAGAISLTVYNDYNADEATNTYPQNTIESTELPDTFFNTVVPTTQNSLNMPNTQKNIQRVFCPTRAEFITIQWSLNNAQMVGPEQESDVQIDMQILWQRPAGRLV